jgi:hypothetical protein
MPWCEKWQHGRASRALWQGPSRGATRAYEGNFLWPLSGVSAGAGDRCAGLPHEHELFWNTCDAGTDLVLPDATRDKKLELS